MAFIPLNPDGVCSNEQHALYSALLTRARATYYSPAVSPNSREYRSFITLNITRRFTTLYHAAGDEFNFATIPDEALQRRYDR